MLLNFILQFYRWFYFIYWLIDWFSLVAKAGRYIWLPKPNPVGRWINRGCIGNILTKQLCWCLVNSLILSLISFLSLSYPSCRYFQCLPKFGLFAPIHKVIRIGFPSTSPAKAKKSKRVAMGVSSLAHSPSSSSISSVSSVASSVGGRPSRAGLVRRLHMLQIHTDSRGAVQSVMHCYSKLRNMLMFSCRVRWKAWYHSHVCS